MEGGSGPGEGSQSGGAPAPPAAEVLLSGVFSLAPALKVDYTLSLKSNAELLMRRRDSPAPAIRLMLSDCIGCYAFQSKVAAYFTVFGYPFRKGWWDAVESRHRVARTFRVLVSQEGEENRAVAETWAKKIRELSAPQIPKLEGEVGGAGGGASFGRRFIGGSGASHCRVDQRVQPA